MEVKPGEASAAPAPAAAAREATVGFQSPAPPPAAEKGGSSSGVLVSPPMVTAGMAAGGVGVAGPVVKVAKKRGRPRKYGPEGSLIWPLNAMPISASAPMAAAVAAGPYTPAAAVGAAMKRGRGRPLDFAAAGKQRQHQHHQYGFHFDSLGDMVACSAGTNFTPHIITVAPGEVRGDREILSQVVSSQADLLARYGGVAPKMAEEAHALAIDQVVQKALNDAKVSESDLSAVAVTIGPGLSLCLRVGVHKARKIAKTFGLPFVGVHHMEAHALVSSEFTKTARRLTILTDSSSDSLAR